MRGRWWLASTIVLVIGCGEPLRLPDEGVQLTVVQRETAPLPGSGDRLFLRLGDITAQQVLVNIVEEGGRSVLNTKSVQVGDVIPFDVRGWRYYLSVVELRNFPTGDDFGVFELSRTEPVGRGPATRPDSR